MEWWLTGLSLASVRAAPSASEDICGPSHTVLFLQSASQSHESKAAAAMFLFITDVHLPQLLLLSLISVITRELRGRRLLSRRRRCRLVFYNYGGIRWRPNNTITNPLTNQLRCALHLP